MPDINSFEKDFPWASLLGDTLPSVSFDNFSNIADVLAEGLGTQYPNYQIPQSYNNLQNGTANSLVSAPAASTAQEGVGQHFQAVPRPGQIPETVSSNSIPDTTVPLLDISQRRFHDPDEARKYLEKVYWRPLSKTHGLPQTLEDRLVYVKKIHDALVDTAYVQDTEFWEAEAKKFLADGVWGRHPASFEAIAHKVVDICINIHEEGVHGILYRHYPAMKNLWQGDRSFTFAQRIHFMAFLLRHFKFHADSVMKSVNTANILARIWTTLMEQGSFRDWWQGFSMAERNHHLYVVPYEGVPANQLTTEEKMAIAQELPQEEHNRGIQKRPFAAVNSAAGGPSPKRR
ncbi:hypothetical protein GQ44DRAFT_299027 [Phaeosphaeriaceae sp. PMI808]|nr:hypothetical protein GQ44DRAFT_299027 [Phaeosphaeriaceae sp. PMI808]